MFLIVLLITLFIMNTISAQEDDDYFEPSSSPLLRTFRPFFDSPLKVSSSTTEATSAENRTLGETLESTDEFVNDQDITSSSDTSQPTYPLASLSPNSLPSSQSTLCNYVPQPSCGGCAPNPCYCAAPKPACLCIPRPPPICPPPPPPLLCPPPSCPKPLPCAPCLQLPTLQPPCVCSAPPLRPIPQNDCCSNCNRPCGFGRSKFTHAMHGVRTIGPDEMEERAAKCNSRKLRQLIAEHISLDMDEAKRRIQFAAQQELGTPINVVCGSGEFSYLVHAQLYCQHSFYLVTCYAFQSN